MADNIDSGTQSLQVSTNYNLKTLTLFTSLNGGGIELSTFMIELNLFEDIYSPTISGEIVLQDSLGLISNYRLNGTEFIQVQLQKTTNDKYFISRNYRVYKISKRVTSDSNNYEVYVINFCSEEFLLSEQYRLSKSAKGTEIHNIVLDILNNYLQTKKPIYYDTTSGVYDFILPNKKLFETINWLSTYAQASNKVGADMLFYENHNGYHFHSLQSLYQQNAGQSYKFDPKNISNQIGLLDINQQLTNATDFQVLDFFDTLSAISNGAFANKVITIDPLNRKYDSTTGVFDYSTYSGKTMNPYGLTNNYQNRLSGTMYGPPPNTLSGLEMGTLRLASSNSEEKKIPYVAQKPDYVANDIRIEQYLPNRVSQLALANYMRIRINVPGDPLVSVGQTVNFSTFGIDPINASGNNPSRDPDPFYSGKYLVTAVRHIVKNKGYITVIELSKESVTSPYSGTNSSLQNFIDGVQI
jgi:hypothetical protein